MLPEHGPLYAGHPARPSRRLSGVFHRLDRSHRGLAPAVGLGRRQAPPPVHGNTLGRRRAPKYLGPCGGSGGGVPPAGSPHSGRRFERRCQRLHGRAVVPSVRRAAGRHVGAGRYPLGRPRRPAVLWHQRNREGFSAGNGGAAVPAAPGVRLCAGAQRPFGPTATPGTRQLDTHRNLTVETGSWLPGVFLRLRLRGGHGAWPR